MPSATAARWCASTDADFSRRVDFSIGHGVNDLLDAHIECPMWLEPKLVGDLVEAHAVVPFVRIVLVENQLRSHHVLVDTSAQVLDRAILFVGTDIERLVGDVRKRGLKTRTSKNLRRI